MNFRHLISMFYLLHFSLSAFALEVSNAQLKQISKEANDAYKLTEEAKVIPKGAKCPDTVKGVNEVPPNLLVSTGAAPSATIYTLDSQTTKDKVKAVLEEFYSKYQLYLYKVEASASYKPWGADKACTGEAVFYNSAKLKECNDKLAGQRADNAISAAKSYAASNSKYPLYNDGVFEKGETIARADKECEFYDITRDAYPGGDTENVLGVSDPYLKYQYVKLFFKKDSGCKCCDLAGIKPIQSSSITTTFTGRKGGKCGKDVICANANGSHIKLSDGTQCTEYFIMTESMTLSMEALWVPDYFNFVKSTDDCKATTTTLPMGYLSRLTGENGKSEFKTWYQDRMGIKGVSEVSHEVTLDDKLFICKKNVSDPSKKIKCFSDSPENKNGTSYNQYADYHYSCFFKDGTPKDLIALGCLKPAFLQYARHIVFNLKWNLPFYSIDEIKKIDYSKANTKTKTMMNSHFEKKSTGLYAESMNGNADLTSLKIKNSDIMDLYDYDDFKNEMYKTLKETQEKNIKEFKLKEDAADKKDAFAIARTSEMQQLLNKKIYSWEDYKDWFKEQTGIEWEAVKPSPTNQALDKGNYCLQVKAPFDGTVWGYSKK